MAPPAKASRPWAHGAGLLLLGLVVSGLSNGVGQHADAGSAVRALGTAGYVAGIAVAGAGVHRVLWIGTPRRPLWIRAVVSAIVTIPVFAAVALALSLLMTVLQIRFAG